jgi:hypothetical protein
MNRLLIILLAFSTIRCSETPIETQTEKPEESSKQETAQTIAIEENSTASAQNLTVTLHDETPTADGARRKPKFQFQAVEAVSKEIKREELEDLTQEELDSMTQEELKEKIKIYALEGVTGTIFRREAEDLKLHAQSGKYNEDSKKADLEGSVTIQTGNMTVQLESVTWYNEQDLLESNSPIQLRSETIKMNAQSLKVFPKINRMILQNSDGFINVKDK